MVGVDKQVTGKKPGLLFVNSKITKPDQLSPEAYADWYTKRHIPDIFKTSGIKQAARWQALDPNQDRPYLALYPLEDLDYLNSDEFRAIPVHDDKLPGSGAIFDVASFDTRYYAFEQLYEPEETKKGWRSTGRYVLQFARENRKAAGDNEHEKLPKFLTLHYFDGVALPEAELAKSGESEWSKKNMAAMKETQIAIFKKLSQFTK
ncbi:hypothetical protein B0A48_15954 [Cryoendolithus antarcticus]|uniref:EthD domain-containing protein n=1 Tax=Cryoendolithus antarcticus TaxID=1507870 RepID=A0A1V8SG39_9PEZI|nr:hypothetical protein B0A48_15954 [Cryoendolithus antarcticus]